MSDRKFNQSYYVEYNFYMYSITTFTVISSYTCYLLCMLPPLSGEPLHQRIFIHYRSVVYISYEFFITLYYILYTGCGTFFKRVCHNTSTLNNKHPSMHIIVIKSETHPLMHTIMLKSKAHRCGKIRHIDLVKFTAKFKK